MSKNILILETLKKRALQKNYFLCCFLFPKNSSTSKHIFFLFWLTYKYDEISEIHFEAKVKFDWQIVHLADENKKTLQTTGNR